MIAVWHIQSHYSRWKWWFWCQGKVCVFPELQPVHRQHFDVRKKNIKMSLPGLQLERLLWPLTAVVAWKGSLCCQSEKEYSQCPEQRIINNQYFIHGKLHFYLLFIAFIITGAVFIPPYFSVKKRTEEKSVNFLLWMIISFYLHEKWPVW